MRFLEKVDSALILSLITVGAFFIGWLNLWAYYGAFGLPLSLLGLNFNEYLMASVWPFLFLAIAIFDAYNEPIPQNAVRFHFFLSYMSPIILVFVWAFSIFDRSRLALYFFFLLLPLLLMVVAYVLAMHKISFRDLFISSELDVRFMTIGILFGLLAILACLMGFLQAKGFKKAYSACDVVGQNDLPKEILSGKCKLVHSGSDSYFFYFDDEKTSSVFTVSKDKVTAIKTTRKKP